MDFVPRCSLFLASSAVCCNTIALIATSCRLRAVETYPRSPRYTAVQLDIDRSINMHRLMSSSPTYLLHFPFLSVSRVAVLYCRLSCRCCGFGVVLFSVASLSSCRVLPLCSSNRSEHSLVRLFSREVRSWTVRRSRVRCVVTPCVLSANRAADPLN